MCAVRVRALSMQLSAHCIHVHMLNLCTSTSSPTNSTTGLPRQMSQKIPQYKPWSSTRQVPGRGQLQAQPLANVDSGSYADDFELGEQLRCVLDPILITVVL